MPLQNDGMPDIGNLPKKVVAIRNKQTGIVITREQCIDADSWDNYVRLAYNHQDQMDMLDSIPGEGDETEEEVDTKSPIKSGKTPKKTLQLPTLKDGTPITKASLEKLHYKTMRTLAVSYDVEVDGKTPAAIIEDTLKKIDSFMANAEE